MCFLKNNLLTLCFTIACLVGCSSVPERNFLPAKLISQASIPEVPDARFWVDEWPTFSIDYFDSLTKANINKHFSGVYGVPHNYLAISGGGANGAFGAGLLAGWAANGTRPEFNMVTGVSTGALTAPFIFLGTEYDDEIKTLYTTTKTTDIAKNRGLISGLLSDSMADTTPLKNLIKKYVTQDIIDSIGKEHKRGRRLFVGTLNLDAARTVIWNIGAIAASDYPEKTHLIHEILRASSAIPVAFPPVMIPVEINGRQYDEMHVDGGTGSQVFIYPAVANWKAITKKLKVKGKPKVFIIRNSFLEPDYNAVIPDIVSIASRSIESLIRTQGVGDLYQIYALCQRDGNDFNLAFIPSDISATPTEAFDPVYMTHLYERGYDMALKGYPWKKGPPGYFSEEK